MVGGLWRWRQRRNRVLNLSLDPGVSYLQRVLGHGVWQRLAGNGVDRVPRGKVAPAAGRDGGRRVRVARSARSETVDERQLFVCDRRQQRFRLAPERLHRVDWLANATSWRRRAVTWIVHAEHLCETVLHNHHVHALFHSSYWWIASLLLRALDSRLDGRGFNSRPPRQIVGWVPVSVSIQASSASYPQRDGK